MRTSHQTELSIVVVNWNACDLLHRCLSDIYTAVKRPRFELIVVDNGSQDNSVAMVKACFPGVRLLQNNTNVGFAKANNQAFGLCRGREFLLLNNDAFLVGDCVERMHDYLEKHPDAGIVGASLRFPDGRWQLSHWPLPKLGSELLSMLALDKLLWRKRYSKSPIETGAVSGACLMGRSRLLKELGFLDERFFFFGEEVDLCYRASVAGWKVVHLPEANVIHIGGGTAGATAERMLLLYRAKILYFEKHFGRWQAEGLALTLGLSSVFKLGFFALAYVLSMGKVRRVKLWWKVVLNSKALRGRTTHN